jgi:hypothetical protein
MTRRRVPAGVLNGGGVGGHRRRPVLALLEIGFTAQPWERAWPHCH